jgi:hypothetical protein
VVLIAAFPIADAAFHAQVRSALASGWPEVAAAAPAPELPPEAPPIPPLRRGPNGQIEVIAPDSGSAASTHPCSRGAICVGRGQSRRTLREALLVAHDGDVIEIVGGTYRESAAVERRKLTVRGVAGRPHFDCAGIALAEGKACLFLDADGVVLDNLEISGAVLPADAGTDGACVRNAPNLGFTLRGVICHGSQEGVLSNGGTVVVESSEFFDNGWAAGGHNGNFAGDCPSLTVRGSIFRDARAGTEFASRCAKTIISDSTFRSTHGGRAIEFPDGGETLVYRSTIAMSLTARSPEILTFATESCRYPASLVLKQVQIDVSRADAEIRNHGRCPGHAIILEAVTFEGPMPQLFGDVRRN